MKGTVIKREKDWGIVNNQSGEFFYLHPDDVNEIANLSQLFDNVESRIFNSPIVDYEIVENHKMSDIVTYAKIK